MPTFDTTRLREAANADPEFRLAARFWHALIRVEAGDEPYELRLEDGEIVAFDHVRGAQSGGEDIRIAASKEGWEQFLAPVPRPFFQDLNAAVFREGFVLEGDPVVFGPYYPALRRFWDVARAVRQEG